MDKLNCDTKFNFENAIEVNNLNKLYDKKKKILNMYEKCEESFRLKNVSFNLPKGTIMGLVGENGAGKTTIIDLILDYQKKDSGEIKIFGKDLSYNAHLKEYIGIVSDVNYLPPKFKISQIENIYKRAFKNWDENYFNELRNKFKLNKDSAYRDLSKGMQMKLAIALALSHKPKLLVLDEPTSGLDPIIRDEFLDILYDFIKDENNSILISSHIISDLEKVCDYITFISNGEVVLSDLKDNLKDKYGILHLSGNEINNIDKDAIVSIKNNKYSKGVLVRKDLIDPNFDIDVPSLEDLFLYTINSQRRI